MNRRRGHTPKNPQEKRAYINYIKSINYEPTLEEGLNFDQSNDNDLNYEESTSRRSRKEPISDKISKHFEENWVGWIISAVILVMFYFMIESKVNIAKIFERLENIGKSNEQITNDINQIKTNQHNQDLQIQENRIKTENLEKTISNKK